MVDRGIAFPCKRSFWSFQFSDMLSEGEGVVRSFRGLGMGSSNVSGGCEVSGEAVSSLG
jgi:hypothetical protein